MTDLPSARLGLAACRGHDLRDALMRHAGTLGDSPVAEAEIDALQDQLVASFPRHLEHLGGVAEGAERVLDRVALRGLVGLHV